MSVSTDVPTPARTSGRSPRAVGPAPREVSLYFRPRLDTPGPLRHESTPHSCGHYVIHRRGVSPTPPPTACVSGDLSNENTESDPVIHERFTPREEWRRCLWVPTEEKVGLSEATRVEGRLPSRGDRFRLAE